MKEGESNTWEISSSIAIVRVNVTHGAATGTMPLHDSIHDASRVDEQM